METAAATRLTADIAARAIIASAREYGDDPVRAVTALRGRYKRSLAAAVAGMADALAIPEVVAGRVFHMERASLARAKAKGGEAFRAASRAASYAGWRPEARESVVAGAGHEELLPTIAADQVEAAEVPPLAPRTPLPGRMTFHTHPSQPPPLISTASVARAERPVRDLVLEALADGPLNSMSLAYRVDAKEMTVSSTLTQLAHEGLVVSEAVENGPRRLRWALAA